MGFLHFCAYKHPLLNFFFQNPDDNLKGWLRRSVILNVITLTFTFAIINDQLVYHGEENTRSDMTELFDNQHVTGHLIVTIVFTVFIFLLEWINEFIYGITQWRCMQAPCCACFKYAIYTDALWLFLINLIIYAALLRGQPELFEGWMLTYGLYTLVITPVWILLSWFCFGGKERERVRELQEEKGYRDAPDSKNKDNALTYV